MTLENVLKETRHDSHTLEGSIYMKCPDQANPEREKADLWSTGAGGVGVRSVCFMD